MNSTHPRGTFASLFADLPVMAEQIALSEAVPLVRAKEAAQIQGAVRRRRVEFAAGRYCARRALLRLGVRDYTILNGEDRAPRWPRNVVGSITHTGTEATGLSGAAVALEDHFKGIGIDVETATPLHWRVWDTVLTTAERRAAASWPEELAGYFAKVVFSAKESFYKAQYAVTRRFCGFHDAEIVLNPSPGSVNEGTFMVRVVGALRGLASDGLGGRYQLGERFILTGMVVRA